jgi:hypothetical protein
MQKLILSLALAVALPAFAQTAGSNATGNANAGSVAVVNLNQSAPANSTATVNSTSAATVNSTSTNHNTNDGKQEVDYSGKYSVKSAPQVYAPPVGVTAPCVIGASLGVSGMGFGFGGGTGIVDSGCERRAVSSLMQSYGHVEAAKEMLCEDPTAAAAYARAGMPCKAAASSQAVAPAPTKTAQSGATSDAQCVTDPYIAVRIGKPVCK